MAVFVNPSTQCSLLSNFETCPLCMCGHGQESVNSNCLFGWQCLWEWLGQVEVTLIRCTSNRLLLIAMLGQGPFQKYNLQNGLLNNHWSACHLGGLSFTGFVIGET